MSIKEKKVKFVFNLKNNKTYAEVGQPNPLRWKTLFMEKDGSFTDQSGWVKCKDFYNDTVAFFKAGSVFSIYGYENNIKKNKDGVYFLLRNIHDRDQFLHNIGVMNTQMEKDLGAQVVAWPQEAKDEMVVLLPNEVWESTYRISMVTMCVRLCNYGVKYDRWADFWTTNAPSHTIDHAFSPAAIKNAKTLGFKVPDKFSKYWYYCGDDYNSEKKPAQTGGTIHNNGCTNWSMFMEAAK